MVNEAIARPNQIWVYDFVAAPATSPPTPLSAARSVRRAGHQQPSRIETGRQLGALIAKDLVADIQAMGLPALQAGPGSSPQVGDGVIRGYLISVEGGSAVKPLGKDTAAVQILFKQSNAPKLPVAPENIPDGLRLTFVDHDATVADFIS